LKHKPGKKIKINRIPERVRQLPDETINKIIDEALYCHISFIQDGHPFIIPTIHTRMNDHLVFHGAKASRLL
jgi:nitroimidazol reductase NimA-like FMN-containing flavoprotein (pyridoxamine 5'-phosphate oxidase superfamily)